MPTKQIFKVVSKTSENCKLFDYILQLGRLVSFYHSLWFLSGLLVCATELFNLL